MNKTLLNGILNEIDIAEGTTELSVEDAMFGILDKVMTVTEYYSDCEDMVSTFIMESGDGNSDNDNETVNLDDAKTITGDENNNNNTKKDNTKKKSNEGALDKIILFIPRMIKKIIDAIKKLFSKSEGIKDVKMPQETAKEIHDVAVENKNGINSSNVNSAVSKLDKMNKASAFIKKAVAYGCIVTAAGAGGFVIIKKLMKTYGPIDRTDPNNFKATYDVNSGSFTISLPRVNIVGINQQVKKLNSKIKKIEKVENSNKNSVSKDKKIVKIVADVNEMLKEFTGQITHEYYTENVNEYEFGIDSWNRYYDNTKSSIDSILDTLKRLSNAIPENAHSTEMFDNVSTNVILARFRDNIKKTGTELIIIGDLYAEINETVNKVFSGEDDVNIDTTDIENKLDSDEPDTI